MRRNTKLTFIVSIVAVLFVFVVMAVAYQYFVLADLQNQLNERNSALNNYNQLYSDTIQQIQEVQTSSYIEKWARSMLNWVGEGEIRIII